MQLSSPVPNSEIVLRRILEKVCHMLAEDSQHAIFGEGFRQNIIQACENVNACSNTFCQENLLQLK